MASRDGRPRPRGSLIGVERAANQGALLAQAPNHRRFSPGSGGRGSGRAATRTRLTPSVYVATLPLVGCRWCHSLRFSELNSRWIPIAPARSNPIGSLQSRLHLSAILRMLETLSGILWPFWASPLPLCPSACVRVSVSTRTHTRAPVCVSVCVGVCRCVMAAQ